MDKFRYFIQWFVTITTAIVFLCAVSTTASGVETVPTAMLWQALAAGAACSLATVLFFPTESHSRRRAAIGIAAHFVSLCIIMVWCGVWFGWIAWAVVDVAFMIGCVVAVYAFTVGVSYLLEKRQVDQMNHILKEKYPKTEDPDTKH